MTPTAADSRLYLCAPVNAIVEGIYEEHIPFSAIKRHGDFGLGTFDRLDGEMVMLDGRVYQMRADGCVVEVGDDALTPFAAVTFYRPERHLDLDGELSHDDFLRRLQETLPSPNIFYAFRIEGEFAYMKVRSVPKSECYIPLVEIAKEQPVFEFDDIHGTLAGFYTPDFMASVSVPGMHLHFLSDDLAHGGHLLTCRPRRVRVGIQPIYTVELALPTTPYYLGWDFQRNVRDDLDRAEK
ncbi:acetolactate decarboxylase [Promineifilum sp.]|uniref:acetolactate decarboxylase n=1 Tax=Promineifilum sp. TaxID=2664178 RepID=UPI0035B4EA7E